MRWSWLQIWTVSALTIVFLLSTSYVVTSTEPTTHIGTGAYSNSLRLGAESANKILQESAKSKVTRLCTLPAQSAGGIYPISKKEVYVENYSTGSLMTCGSGKSTIIANPPAGFSSFYYYGMSGAKHDGKLDLLLVSEKGYGWMCLGASTKGCASTSSITPPSSFCSSEPGGICGMTGVVLFSNLSFMYLDSGAALLVSCTADAASCWIDAASSAFSSQYPVNMAMDGSTLYVSDDTCTGDVWVGNATSLSILKSVGDDLGGIAVHKGQVYVGVAGTCTASAAHILDVTTGKSLPSPFTNDNTIPGVDSDLQFSASLTPGGVWETG
jgi:hypothetical protein